MARFLSGTISLPNDQYCKLDVFYLKAAILIFSKTSKSLRGIFFCLNFEIRSFFK